MEISNCQYSLVLLANKVGATPQEVWSLLAGNVTDNKNLAQALEVETGLTAKGLMFHPTVNLRNGVLLWMIESLSTKKHRIAKNTIWRFIHGYCSPGPNMRKRLRTFAGIDVKHWEPENAGYNWMLSRRGVDNAKARARQSGDSKL